MTTLKPEPSLEKDKPKSRAGRTFPVTFVVDQQLEACVEAIRQNSRRSNVQIDLLDEQADADKVSFSAALFHESEAITHIWGTMRRWQGTSTRIEGYARNMDEDAGAMVIGCPVLALIVFSCLYTLGAAPILLFSASSVPRRLPEVSPLIIPAVICIVVIVIMSLARIYFNKRWLIRRLRKMVETGIVRR